MNILFLTLADISSIHTRGLYEDLIRKFNDEGHHMYVISPVERRTGQNTHMISEENTKLLKVRIGNTQKTNIVEKGISTVLIESILTSALKKYFSDVIFDVVLYSTPPVTFLGTVEFVKKRDGARSYLMLKDIFPQNAIDIGLMKTTGIKGVLYRHFRKLEKRLYEVSDKIGCTSNANIKYVIDHNPDIDKAKLEIFPNCIDVINKSIDANTRNAIREKYRIPTDKIVLVYGGNLGKPQDIPFIIECLKRCSSLSNTFFLVVGDGTEFRILEDYYNRTHQTNFKLMKRLPKEDYDTMVSACDVGLIFLDHRFSVPNIPSRMLSYMQSNIPIIAATDCVTDIRDFLEKGDYGWWCKSTNSDAFYNLVKNLEFENLHAKGHNGYKFLIDNFSVDSHYKKILNLKS